MPIGIEEYEYDDLVRYRDNKARDMEKYESAWEEAARERARLNGLIGEYPELRDELEDDIERLRAAQNAASWNYMMAKDAFDAYDAELKRREENMLMPLGPGDDPPAEPTLMPFSEPSPLKKLAATAAALGAIAATLVVGTMLITGGSDESPAAASGGDTCVTAPVEQKPSGMQMQPGHGPQPGAADAPRGRPVDAPQSPPSGASMPGNGPEPWVAPGPVPQGAVVQPRVAPAPQGAVAQPRVATAPEGAVVRPQVAPAPEGFAVRPEVAPAPEGAVVQPRVAPVPEGTMMQPRTGTGPAPEDRAVQPQVAPAPQGVVVQPQVAPAPQGIVVQPQSVPGPILGGEK
ncbi:hypothetical protein GV794_25505 [Nocardia cyriacigeorgica]|uniref:Uncharacterized protein n=1 Tax=Nocardia cyriacigeorgica TaxID=135487 RepID=A0ABX0CR48_9NOCA|nr:hypothetical protein [Nocardia cyriacigeorgica]NEW58970.1 hypothetical protein [Nocardia cyriacigeorgica]